MATNTNASDTVTPASQHVDYVEVLPAYGRDYKSATAARADWEAGKDFIEATTRRYCSKRDFDKPNVIVTIRYNKLQRLASTTD